MPEVGPGRYRVDATWDDVPHLSEEAKAQQLAGMPPHLRDARSKGIPSIGAGAIYPVQIEDLQVNPFPIPSHWARGYGLDVGWRRTAALWIAWDRDNDVMYAHSEHYAGQQMPAVHAGAIKARGEWIKGAIDPASRGRQQGDGKQLIHDYKQAGLHVVAANNAVEAGLLEVLMRMSEGRLKYFSTLQNLAIEHVKYHRDENGKIVKKNDHLLDCLRYAIMTPKIFATKPETTAIHNLAIAADKRAGY